MTQIQPAFTVEALPLPVAQRPHRGHNRPGVEQGATVYIVQHVRTRRVFAYAYLHRDAAEAIAAKANAEWSNLDSIARVRLLDFNYRRVYAGFVPTVTARKAEEIPPYVSRA